LYPDGKNHALPSLHHDSFVAKVPGLYPVLASGNIRPYTLGPIAGPLGNIQCQPLKQSLQNIKMIKE